MSGQRVETTGRGVESGLQSGADQGGTRETPCPVTICGDATVQVVNRCAQGHNAVGVPKILIAPPQPRSHDQPLPPLLSSLPTGQPKRPGNLRPGSTGLPGPIDQLKLPLIQRSPRRPDLRQPIQLTLHPSTIR